MSNLGNLKKRPHQATFLMCCMKCCLEQVHRVGSNHQLLVGGDDYNLYL